ncbi:MAG: DUF1848 domain-containing protein [Muribaculaceae bacterium]|nr:DUF1848 domain-containing protein [Muribaculaceae bacterium]
MILSASRATDIPAFYSEWFFDRLEKGYCLWRNPFNGIDNYVSFQDVRFIVFWSKNPAPLIPYLERLQEKSIRCYIQYTLNDYESERLEPGVPTLAQRIETFKTLADKLGKGSVVWRFDPMILTDKMCLDNLLEKVRNIGDQLKGYTEKLVFSFVDIASYRKVKSNLEKHGVNYFEWNETLMIEFAEKLSAMNRECGWNFTLTTCSERIDLAKYGIAHNRCVDDELISRIAWQDKYLMDYLGIRLGSIERNIFEEEILPEGAWKVSDSLYAIRIRGNRDLGQRQYCGCVSSKDIGAYNTCPHGCVYCYANTTPESARKSSHRHNPRSDSIIK